MSEEARATELESALGDGRPAARPHGSLVQPLIAALLLTLVCLPLPYVALENDADTSLCMLLDFARQHHLQFGVDFVNTYGPLGFLIFPYYSGQAATARLVADVLLAFAATAGFCLLAWRQSLPWRALFLALFVWTTGNIRVGPDLLLNVMFLCWGLLCFLEDRHRLSLCAGIAAALAGFCAVAKISFLVVGAGGISLLALDVWLRGRRLLATSMPLIFLGILLTGWLVTGQEIGNLPTFLAGALATIKGYNAALGVDVRPSLRLVGIVLALMAAHVVVLRSMGALSSETGPLWRRRFLLFAWTFSLTFAAWKHGFVRTDSYHVALFLGFMPLLLLSLEALPTGSRTVTVWIRGATLTGSLASVAALQIFCLQPLQISLPAPWNSAKINVRRLLNPGEFRRQSDSLLDEHRKQAQLPQLREIVGTAPVDVFGFRQSYALFNGMNYRPRPVSQSYAACNPALMRINERFLQSGKGADFFLFDLSPLESKFSVLEDATVVRELMANFKPIASEERFVLMKRVASTEPRVRLLYEADVKPGEPIDLRQFGDTSLWIEIELAPSWLGVLRQFVHQPPVVRLAAWQAPGEKVLYRHQARASLLASGFVASPLIRWTKDILDLNNAALRPGAYTLELNGQDRFWKSSARVRIFNIEPSLASSPPPTKIVSSDAAEAPANLPKLADQSKPATATPHLFTIFRGDRWRPDQPPPGGIKEILAYAFILSLPVAGTTTLFLLYKRLRRNKQPTSIPGLVLGNALVLATLLALAWAIAETYFQFVYDTTDSLGYTRVSERWVQRHWRVNTAGVRDNIEYFPSLPPATRRLSFVGDSFTAGHGIKDVEDRFANRLRQAHPDWQVHVLANVGLDTGAETVLVNKLAAKGYAFDQVVLVYCLNDIGDIVSQQDEAFTRMFDGMKSGNWLTQNSYALNLFSQRYQAGRNPYLRNYFSFVREAYQGEIWEQQKTRLREFREAVESRGGKLAVVTFPFMDALGPAYPYRTIHEKLDRFWRESGVPHLDLLPVYANLSPRDLVVNPHDAHPNERANRLAAEAIDRFLFP